MIAWITTVVAAALFHCVYDVTRAEQIRIGILLPFNGTYPFTERYILPVADVARRHILTEGTLNSDYRLVVSSRDTKCDEPTGMNEAIIYHMERNVSAFFGPICDYVAAPVARQMSFWNRPMLSIGAMAREFLARKHDVYPMLTRTGSTNLNTLAHALKETIMLEFNWSTLKILYERSGFGEINPDFCHFATDSLVNSKSILEPAILTDHYRITTQTWSDRELERLLLDEIGTKYAGQYVCVCV